MTPDELYLKAILDRIVAKKQTEDDLIAVGNALTFNGDQIVLQDGEKNINIGQVGGDIHIGDVVTYQGTDAETIKQLIEELEVKKKDTNWNFLSFFSNRINRLLINQSFYRQYCGDLSNIFQDIPNQGPGGFKLNLEKVFVPLQLADFTTELDFNMYNNPIESRNSEQGESDWQGTIWNSIEKICKDNISKRIVILGKPGAGKTTLLKHITITYLKKNHKQFGRNIPTLIPVLLSLPSIKQEIFKNPTIVLSKLLEGDPFPQPPSDWWEWRLKNGKVLVMLDGVDEIAEPEHWEKVKKWFDKQITNYPQSLFIITTRSLGEKTSFLIKKGNSLKMKPLNLKQVQQFIENVLPQNNASLPNNKKNIFGYIRRHPTVLTLVSNPLLLHLFVTVIKNSPSSEFALDQSSSMASEHLATKRIDLRTKLYDLMIKHLLEKRENQQPGFEKKKRLLSRLALQFMEQETLELKPTEIGQNHIDQETITEIFREDIDSMQIEEFGGLLLKNSRGRYQFAHKTFQEYLANLEILETNREELLIENITNPWWIETIRFYVAPTEDKDKDATSIIKALLDNSSIYSLSLADNCLRSGCQVQQDVRQQFKEKIQSGLESRDANIFKLAAEVTLSLRLDNLLPLNDQVDIDTNPLTCAEYQLFINNKKDRTKTYKQPDFWGNTWFTNGLSQKPITGLREQDINAFCAWLPIFRQEGNFRYRLPTLAELAQLAEIKGSSRDCTIDCWYLDEVTHKKYGISHSKWQAEKQKYLANQLEKTFELDIEITNLQFALTHALNIDLQRSIDLIFNAKFKNIIDFTHLQNLVMQMDRSLSADEINFNEDDFIIVCQTQSINPKLFNSDLRFIKNSLKPLLDIADDIFVSLKIEIERIQKRVPALLEEQKTSFLNSNKSFSHSGNFSPIRSCLLLMYALWQEIAFQCEQAARQTEKPEQTTWLDLSKDYKKRSEAISKIYKGLVIVDEQRRLMIEENLPDWGGIWIVREQKIKPNLDAF